MTTEQINSGGKALYLTVDPISTQTRQPYAYVGDNPLNSVDPQGTCGVSSVGAAIESINPFSEENCAYQATKGMVEILGSDAGVIAGATGLAAGILAVTGVGAPLAVALAGVSSAASAYAAGQEAARGDTLGAALDGLSAVLGGAGAAEHLLSALDSWAAEAGGAAIALQDSADSERKLAETLDRLGYASLAASILKSVAIREGCE